MTWVAFHVNRGGLLPNAQRVVRLIGVVLVGPAVALTSVALLDLQGRPVSTSPFMLAVLVSAVEAGFWWGLLTGAICEILIVAYVVDASGSPELDGDTAVTTIVFFAVVVVAALFIRSVARARDRAETAVAERDAALMELEELQTFTALLSDALTPDDVVAVTLTGAERLLGARAEVLLDPSTQDRALGAAAGPLSTTVRLGGSRPLGQLCLGFSPAAGVARPSLIKAVADLSGQALERAVLFQQERTISSALQAAILPTRVPTVAGASIAAFYEMASDTSEVGGDWYDLLQHEDGRVTISVGDISGKGLGAAAEMGRLSKTLRIYAAEGYTPGEVLQRADRAMMNGTVGEVFATAICATFDPFDRTVEYACAGHPPPLRISASGEVGYLESCRTTPLSTGVVDAETETITLGAGDTILFYTDGLIERRRRPLDDGLARLARVAPAHCLATPTGGELAALVAEMTRDWPSEDDTCVVTLTMTGGAAPERAGGTCTGETQRLPLNEQLKARAQSWRVARPWDRGDRTEA
jgi:hypothetical protein